MSERGAKERAAAKTLLVVRHAKSSWKDESLVDRDRPLNKRGKSNAPEMGQRLLRRKLIPDTIVSSPALRALLTARAIAEELQFPVDNIVVEEDLYGCGPQDIFDTAALISPEHNVALVVSHNPAITELANIVSRNLIENVPTCGVLTIQANMWDGMENRVLVDFDYPKSGKQYS